MIKIRQCRGIMNYCNAFRKSYCIHIEFPNPNACFNFDSLEEVKEMNFDWPALEMHMTFHNQALPKTLKRLSVDGVITVPRFDHLVQLSLTDSHTALNVESLGRIPLLSLSRLVDLTSLHGLGFHEDRSKNLRNRRVEIKQLSKITDFSPLNSVHTVIINDCKLFKKVKEVRDVKNLTIEDCPNVQKIQGELRNDRLKFTGRMRKIAFIKLSFVKELDLGLVRLSDTRLVGLEEMKNLERIVIPIWWKEKGHYKGWRMLKERYEKHYHGNGGSVIYIRKEA